MKTKELEIPAEWMEEGWATNKVKIKVLSGREAYSVRDEASKVKISESGMEGNFSQQVALLSAVTKFVVEAPWKTNDKAVIAELPEPILNWLQEEYAEMRKFPEKKNESTST